MYIHKYVNRIVDTSPALFYVKYINKLFKNGIRGRSLTNDFKILPKILKIGIKLHLNNPDQRGNHKKYAKKKLKERNNGICISQL